MSEEYDQLWIIIDRFTKMVYLLPLKKNGKMAADLAITFAREIWQHHRLSMDIVCN